MTRESLQTELEYHCEIADRLAHLSAVIYDDDLQREQAENLGQIRYLIGMIRVLNATGREGI